MAVIVRQAIGKDPLVFGVHEIKPLCDFPKGAVRIRMRPCEFTKAYVYTHDEGIQGFYLIERDGCWHPGPSFGANVRKEASTH